MRRYLLFLLLLAAAAMGTPLAYLDEDYFGTYVSRDHRLSVRFSYCDAGVTSLEAFGERYSANEFTIELLGFYRGSQVMEVRFADKSGFEYCITLLVLVEVHRVRLVSGHLVRYKTTADGKVSIDKRSAMQFKFDRNDQRPGIAFNCD